MKPSQIISLMYKWLITFWIFGSMVVLLLLRISYSGYLGRVGYREEGFAHWIDRANHFCSGLPYVFWILVGGGLMAWVSSKLTLKVVDKMLIKRVEEMGDDKDN